MARLLLLTNAMAPSTEVLPALGLLGHSVRVAPAEVGWRAARQALSGGGSLGAGPHAHRLTVEPVACMKVTRRRKYRLRTLRHVR